MLNVAELVDKTDKELALFYPIRRRAWTDEEDRFLKDNLSRLSDEALGAALGRTAAAIHVRRVRMGMGGRMKQAGVITAHQASVMLGIDIHKFTHWVRSGFVPHRVMPSDSDREILLLDVAVFRRWVANPKHWIYFDIDTLPDAGLRALCKRRAERWGDAWWSTLEVADYHDAGHKWVLKALRDGLLAGVQRDFSARNDCDNDERHWKVWYIRRSVAMASTAFIRKGTMTPRAIAYVRKARAEGDAWQTIAQRMRLGVKAETLRVRMKRLEE